MFGGLCFLLADRMCCGVVNRNLVVRVGPERYEDALGQAHARPMDFTGRPLRGFVYVDPAGYRSEQSLAQWVRRAVLFVGQLPARSKKRPASKRRGVV